MKRLLPLTPILITLLIALVALGSLEWADAVPVTQASADRTDATVDKAVLAEMKQQRIPGLALGVYRDDQIMRAQGYGLANVELKVPVKPETLFQSGSVGKQFVSMAIMMLVEEGKVNFDESVTKYFPDAPESWRPIKLKNLLSHTSGLAEYESDARTKPGAPFYLRLDHTEGERGHAGRKRSRREVGLSQHELCFVGNAHPQSHG
jgi:CubicO group peptidase (beta-lactamase class C family)